MTKYMLRKGNLQRIGEISISCAIIELADMLSNTLNLKQPLSLKVDE
jgi:hypothetical protein